MPHQSPEEEREEHPQVEYKTVRRPRRKFDQEVQVLGDKPLIYPMGNGLEPSKEAAEAVRRAIANLYRDFYPTYDAMMKKEEMEEEIFQELGKFAVWEPYHHDEVKRNFRHVAKNRLPSMLHDAKRTYEKMKLKGKTHRPLWIGEEIWKKVLEYWKNDPTFLKRSKTNKVNRSSAKGGNLNTQGCVSLPARARGLKKKKGGDVDMAEIHKDTHTKSSGGYVDQRSEDTQREYWKAIEKYRQEHPEYHSYEDIPDIIRREIFLEVSGSGKKNKKYGFGKLAPNVHRQNLFHIPTPEECSRPASFTPAAQAEIQRLSRELQAQREEMARQDQQIAAMVQEEVKKQVAMYHEQMSASSVRKAPNDDDDDDVDSSDDEDPSVSSDSN
ncbi:hypothetical protein QL285_044947 [Trifolium repens]|nr:hypothetical protein QL285_044947 [Trifolium repens]